MTARYFFTAALIAAIIALAVANILDDNVHKMQDTITNREVRALAISSNELSGGINLVRVESGLAELKREPLLDLSAGNKAKDMCLHDYWAHEPPEGSWWDFIFSSGFEYVTASENLAFGYESSTEIINAWRASESHFGAIIDPDMDSLGVGIELCPEYQGGRDKYIIVTHFALGVSNDE